MTIMMLLSLSSCATDLELRLQKKHKGIDPELQTYVQEFVVMSEGKVTKKHLNRFTMGFKKYDDSSSIAGTCHYTVNEVDISIDWWNSVQTPSERLELVFHELGHCILKRGHTKPPYGDGFLKWLERLGFKLGIFDNMPYMFDNCPASFMHPYTLNDRCINKHFRYYINELFKNGKNNNVIDEHKVDNTYYNKKKQCEPARVINKTNEWTEKDVQTINRASRTCIERYKTCLKTFIKKAPLTYNAICE